MRFQLFFTVLAMFLVTFVTALPIKTPPTVDIEKIAEELQTVTRPMMSPEPMRDIMM